jgi:hypothetical protein
MIYEKGLPLSNSVTQVHVCNLEADHFVNQPVFFTNYIKMYIKVEDMDILVRIHCTRRDINILYDYTILED